MSLALLLAALLGGLIGLERELHDRPAGLRTHVLVCVGAALITLISSRLALDFPGRTDPTRIAAQIVSGIGFLGAGAILRAGFSIHGLTTAASIWTTAGIGIAVGAAPRYGELAVIATLIVVFTLWPLNQLEEWIKLKGKHQLTLEVKEEAVGQVRTLAMSVAMAYHLEVGRVELESGRSSDTRAIVLQVRLPKDFQRTPFLRELSADPAVLGVHLD
jgi:putative Mg2+ transporter-C (MgtC) family protein